MPVVSGMCSMIAFSYYGNKIRAEFQDPNYKAQKYVQFLNKLTLFCVSDDSVKEELYKYVLFLFMYLLPGLR